MTVVFDDSGFLMKVVLDEIDHFHHNFDESVPNRCLSPLLLHFFLDHFFVLCPLLFTVFLIVARLATVSTHNIPHAVLTFPLSKARRAFLALSFAFAQSVDFHWMASSVLSLDLTHSD